MLLVMARHAVAPRALKTRSLGGMQTHCVRRLSGSSSALQSVVVRSQDEMEALGARVSSSRRSGDVIFLRGDLGCGKTCFARGFIRAMTEDPKLHVTSPTYLLVNTYDAIDDCASSRPVIHHVDLYRLDTVSEIDATALGLTDAFSDGISLVEWPQRLLASSMPADRLDVDITYDENDPAIRHVVFTPFGDRWRDFAIQ